MVQPLWEAAWRSLKTLNIELACWPMIQQFHFWVHPYKKGEQEHEEVFAHYARVALFTGAQR